MYDPVYTRAFYNMYAEAEWLRLEKTAFGRLKAIIHNDFIKRYIRPGDRVLDAGSGPGRFSITITENGGKVTVLDISDHQLTLAKQKLTEAKVLGCVEQFIEADIVDLSMFSTGHFDSVVCYGGALSYVCEKRYEAATELIRVTRPGGFILVSVMSLLGGLLTIITQQRDLSALRSPEDTMSFRPGLWEVLDTGNLLSFPSKSVESQHAPMHLYTAEELQNLFKDCDVLEVAGSNVTTSEFSNALEEISADSHAWSTLIELERKLNSNPGLVNSGNHIILVARR